MPSSTNQPERLVCSPAGAGGGWELRLGLRSDPRERTGVGGVNTARRGYCATAIREGVREKVCSCRTGKRLFLPSLFPGAQGEGIQSAA